MSDVLKSDENEYGGKSEENESNKSGVKPASEAYSYLEDGRMIYTDPESKTEYILDATGTQWVKRSEFDEKYSFDGKTYHYTDKESGLKYKWDLEKNDWISQVNNEADESSEKENPEKKHSESESEEDDNTTEEMRQERRFRKRKAQPGWGRQGEYSTDSITGVQLYKDANDGMTYEWDKSKNAWFPRLDDNFMAQYQMSYGFTPDGKAEPTLPSAPAQSESEVLAEAAAKKAKNIEESKKRAQWFEEDEEKTTKVYVSNLPDDIDEESFLELMSKCGVIDVDIRSNKPKIKIYKDVNGMPKGDALCTYVKVESVTLALTILDGSTSYNKSGKSFVIKVERAKFEMKGGSYDPTKKPKKLGKKELERAQKRKDKLLAWIPDQMRGMRKKSEKVIVIENVFSPKDFDLDASLILECSGKLREHCSKFGTVTKVVVYDKHEQGICQVFFRSPEEADMAISMLNGRIYNRTCGAMKAYSWDGKTKYKITETEEEEKERLANWENFLKTDESVK